MDLRERRERLEKLADLEDIHVRAMYHRCLGKTVSEITNILELPNEGTVWDRFTKIFRRLGITGEEELVSQYCPIFLEFIKSEDDLKDWGRIRADMRRLAWELPSKSEQEYVPKSPTDKEDLTETNREVSGPTTPPPQPPTKPQTPLNEKPTQTKPIPSPSDSQPSTVSNQSQPSRRRRSWFVVAISLFILALACIAGARSLFVILGPRLLTPRPTQTLAPPTSLHTVTSQPTNTATVVASQTSLPTSTATITSPTEASLPTPASPEATTVSAGPSGDWAVRIYQSDDANIILVNNHIVGVTPLFESLDWVEINSLLQKGAVNYVTTVNLNREFTGAAWGFNLRHNDVIVWGNEATADSCLFCYAQTVQILPDDTVSEINLRDFNKKKLSGSWSAKVKAADFGVIMVNGVAVAGSYNELDLGWFDITSLLYEGQDNIITVAIWNKDGDYSWDVILRRGETAVWGSDDKGSGQPGEVFFTTVIVDGAGNIVP